MMPDLEADIRRILRISTTLPADKQRALLQSRLIGLGFGQTCSRCGGCGHYSFHAMYGTVCFQCGGSGYVPQRLTPALYADTQHAAADGRLDRYLAKAQEKARISALARNASRLVLTAWEQTGISHAYRWDRCQDSPRDAHIADTYNLPMCQWYERVTAASRNLVGLRRRTARTPEEHRANRAAIEAAAADLATLTAQALAAIEALGADLQTYLQSEGQPGRARSPNHQDKLST